MDYAGRFPCSLLAPELKDELEGVSIIISKMTPPLIIIIISHGCLSFFHLDLLKNGRLAEIRRQSRPLGAVFALTNKWFSDRKIV